MTTEDIQKYNTIVGHYHLKSKITFYTGLFYLPIVLLLLILSYTFFYNWDFVPICVISGFYLVGLFAYWMTYEKNDAIHIGDIKYLHYSYNRYGTNNYKVYVDYPSKYYESICSGEEIDKEKILKKLKSKLEVIEYRYKNNIKLGVKIV